MESKYSAPAIPKLLDIIELMASNEYPISINEIAKQTQISINSVYRICIELENRGYLEKNIGNGFYQLGTKFHFIGIAAKYNINLRTNAIPIMEYLRNECNETVHLCTFSENKLIVLEQVETKQIIKIHVNTGVALYPHASAFGKCILANLNECEIDSYLKNELVILTKNTIVNNEDLKTELAKVKKSNVAFDNEEYMKGVLCVGTPIFDREHKVIASIGLMAPKYRFDNKSKKTIALLKEQGEILSKKMGGF